MTAAAPRVFLVDDHHLFRRGVRAELGDAADVVGEASEVDAAVEMIGERLPDVVLVDVHMPGGGGEAVIRGLAGMRCGPPAISIRRSEPKKAGMRTKPISANGTRPILGADRLAPTAAAVTWRRPGRGRSRTGSEQPRWTATATARLRGRSGPG